MSQSPAQRILVYGAKNSPTGEVHSVEVGELTIVDSPIEADVSFLDYDVVVVYSGTFEFLNRCGEYASYSVDLDRRSREFYTFLKRGGTFIFLLSELQKEHREALIPFGHDLFRRVADDNGICWQPEMWRMSALTCSVKEIEAYIELHGTAYLTFKLPYAVEKKAAIFCRSGDKVVAFAVANNSLFFLPAREPAGHNDALEIAGSAVSAVLRYQQRISKKIPEWLSAFRFAAEEPLREARVKLETEISEINSKLAKYAQLKGLLCYRSDPLVELVCDVLCKRFGINAIMDAQKIEDVRIVNDEKQILAVGEIKGVNRNIRREDINQVDDHRGRRGQPPTSPGFLIVNTFAGATSLAGKEEAPHTNEIAKAAQDNVLILRTLDLLQLVRGVEEGKARAGELQRILFSENGWLCVHNDGSFEIRKK